jgi:hypothetical protein
MKPESSGERYEPDQSEQRQQRRGLWQFFLDAGCRDGLSGIGAAGAGVSTVGSNGADVASATRSRTISSSQ